MLSSAYRGIAGWFFDLVLGVGDGDGDCGAAELSDDARAHKHAPGLVKMTAVLTGNPSALDGFECLAQCHADEVLE